MPDTANLVHQTSVSSGTGPCALIPVNGRNNFAAAFGIGGSAVFWYFIQNRQAVEWEVGVGHLSAAGILERDAVLQNHLGDLNPVNFSPGTKDITNATPRQEIHNIYGIGGLTYKPGSNVNFPLITIDIAGLPKIEWNDTFQVFALNKGLSITNGNMFIAGSLDVEGDGEIGGVLQVNSGAMEFGILDDTSLVRLSPGDLAVEGNVIYRAGGTDIPTGDIADLAITTAKLAADAVTFAKFQNINTDRLLGRDSLGAGDVEELLLSTGLEFTGAGSIRAVLSTQSQAGAGTDNTSLLTPLRATQGALSGVRSNAIMTGGGVCSWSVVNDRVKWTSRLIVIGDAKGTENPAGAGAFFDINMPTSGSIDVVGTTAVTATADGIPLEAWRALYYDLSAGSAAGAAAFHIIAYNVGTTNFVPPPYWVLLVSTNGDSSMSKWGNGLLVPSGQSRTFGGARITDLYVVIGDNVNTISTGVKGFVPIDFSGIITGWTLVADASGSIVIDVWKDTYANFPPTVADTIAGSEKPTLSSVQKNQDLSLSSWTTNLSPGDVLGFNVDSATTVKQVTLCIRITLDE